MARGLGRAVGERYLGSYRPGLLLSEIPSIMPRRQRGLKEFRLRVEGKALEEKPQWRYRYETRPDGIGRSKPLGG
jgi:hypothetical protein